MAQDLIDGESPFSNKVTPTVMYAISIKLFSLSKDQGANAFNKNSTRKTAAKLLTKAKEKVNEGAVITRLSNIMAALISSSEEVTMANVETALEQIYQERMSKKESDEVDEAAEELKETDDELREKIREEVMNEYAEKIFGKDKAKEISDIFDSALIDLNDC